MACAGGQLLATNFPVLAFSPARSGDSKTKPSARISLKLSSVHTKVSSPPRRRAMSRSVAVSWTVCVELCYVMGQIVLGEIHAPVSETFDIMMHLVEKALGGTGDSDCQRLPTYYLSEHICYHNIVVVITYSDLDC